MRHSFAAFALLFFVFGGTLAAQTPAPILQVTEGSATGTPISYQQSATGTNRDFGSQDTGAGPTAAITLFVTNIGTGTLSFATPTMGGTWWNEFVLDANGIKSQLSAGQSTSFTVAFDPATVGPRDAYVQITHTGTNNPTPFEIPVLGNGTSTTVTGTELRMDTQPGNAVAGQVFATSPVVAITDGGGNVDTSDSTSQITVGITGGTGEPGAVLSGTLTVTAVNGYATFSDLSIDTAGADYSLTFGNGTLNSAHSTTFDVTSAGGGTGKNGNNGSGNGSNCSSAADCGFAMQALLLLSLLALAARRRRRSA